jgi:hypothetical protein
VDNGDVARLQEDHRIAHKNANQIAHQARESRVGVMIRVAKRRDNTRR